MRVGSSRRPSKDESRTHLWERDYGRVQQEDRRKLFSALNEREAVTAREHWSLIQDQTERDETWAQGVWWLPQRWIQPCIQVRRFPSAASRATHQEKPFGSGSHVDSVSSFGTVKKKQWDLEPIRKSGIWLGATKNLFLLPKTECHESPGTNTEKDFPQISCNFFSG